MTGVGAELIVIDTGLSPGPASFFEVARMLEPRNAVDYDMVLVPTRQAVVHLAGQFGLNTVPLAQNITDYTRMEDYRSGRRLAFICSRSVSLQALAAEKPQTGNAWMALATHAATRVSQRLRG